MKLKDRASLKTQHIFPKENMVNRCVDQPYLMLARGRYSMANQMFYAEFLRYYDLIYKSLHCGNQPEEVTDNRLFIRISFPNIFPLKSGLEKLDCRKCQLYIDIMCLINVNIQKSILAIYCFCYLSIARLICFIVRMYWNIYKQTN